MSLLSALALLKQLQAALSDEIVRARDERTLLRTLDGKALLERTVRRQQFNATTASLERQLAVEVARAAAVSGLKEVTIANLAEVGGADGAALKDALAELRSLAAALGELDVLNHHLAERTLKVVRGYTETLIARPSAYDRMGRRSAAGT